MSINTEKILHIKEALVYIKKNKLNIQSATKYLYNISQDVPVVIVTCGPSLKLIPKEQIIVLANKCVLIAVKQAHDYLDGSEVIHLINQYNLKKYNYKNKDICVMSTFDQACGNKIFSRSDLAFPHDINLFKSNKQDLLDGRLAITRDFNKYMLINNVERPWGPGIVLELALYLAVHMGAKNVYLIGYDLASPVNKVDQLIKFYNKNKSFSIQGITDFFFEKLPKKFKPIGEKIKYSLGLIYNKPSSMDRDENQVLVDSSADLYKWLKNKGISLYICSDNSYVSRDIPRKNITEIRSDIENMK